MAVAFGELDAPRLYYTHSHSLYLGLDCFLLLDLIVALSMAILYMILIEHFNALASPVVTSLRELLVYVNRATEEGGRVTKGRPRIDVEEEQLMFG